MLSADGTMVDLKAKKDLFSFFQLPYPVQVEIISRLSLEDSVSFEATSRESRFLINDQLVWKKKLWYHSRIINLCLEGRKVQPKNARFFVKDHLLVDMRKLYEVLNPQGEQHETVTEEVDRENFLSKIQQTTPQVMSFSSVGLQDLLNFLNTFFHRPPPIFYDPFSRGVKAPSFILFGPPESGNARRLGLSFVASKNSLFETVGLVKGRPGGLGGGVTVESGNRLMNFLPVRRARPRLLIKNSSTGARFHPDVAEVVQQVDGMIYYLDAKCTCKDGKKLSKRKQMDTPISNSVGKVFESPWQYNAKDNLKETLDDVHPLTNEFYEFEAMLNATPNVFPPILIVLVYNENDVVSSDSDEPGRPEKKEADGTEDIFHVPSDVLHRMQNVENPWMISKVEVHSLRGIHQGINWLCERTRILKGK